jgi:hypothetical protein
MKMKTVLLIAPLAAGMLCAQGFHGNASGTPPTPQQIAQNQTNQLTRFFSLSSTQQSAVLAILEPAETQIAALRTEIQPLRTAFVTAVKANNATQINAELQQIAPLEQQVQSIQAVAAGQIYATVLNSSQQAQITNGLGPLLGGGPGGFGRGRR